MDTFHKHHITRLTTGMLFAVIIALSTIPAFAHNDRKKLAKEEKEREEEQKKLTKEERRRQKAIEKEMESPYKKWINGPISYIITPQERNAFKKLSTDEERDQFIEQFWARRNPSPGSGDNAYKDEFYRRVAYANEHYASGIPGWRTDRGRIYIMYGPPDSIESHPSGGAYMANPNELPWSGPGADTVMTTYPFEDWTYNYIPGLGNNITLEFVDPTMTGEYHLTMNPCEKDAMAFSPNDNTGCQGGVSIGPIWNPNAVIDPSQLSNSQNAGGMVYSNVAMMGQDMDEFNRLDLYAKIFQPPAVKFNDLKAIVTSRLSAQLLPFSVRTDYLKITDDTVLTPITIQVPNREMQFADKNGVMHAVLDIYGQLSTLGGRIADTFQDSVAVDVPRHDFQDYVNQKSVYQKAVYLAPGHYKLSVVIKDDQSGHMGSMNLGIVVPQYNNSKLSNSSLILADLIQPLPTNEVGSGPFVIGGTKVRPSVNQKFTQKQNLGIYMQVYNLGLDPKTHKPAADINYQILRDGKPILNQTEQAAQIKDAAEQVTIEKVMPVKLLQPGKYTLQIKITDPIKNQTDTQTANFQVE
ncbi:MAG: GWxTD domain-containing protein [Acidobacteria bacterium]|nr:GWxTD domain-containing protein [Acidobacteriota bacterium]